MLHVQEAFAAESSTGRGGNSGSLGSSSSRLDSSSRRATGLGEVLNPRRRASGLRTIRIRRYKVTNLDRTLDIVVVPDFVQGAGTAAEGYGDAGAFGGEGGLDLGGCVGLGC